MQTVLRTILLTGCIGLLASGAFAAEKGKSLSVGDPAPQFTLLDDEGKEWKSSEHYGKKIVVVYFYPADMTGGCTKQACGFRDDMSKLNSEGIEVVGVSGDSVRNHQLFKQAHDLNFTLLADTEGKVAEKFGVPFTPGERTVKAVIGGEEFDLVRTVTTRRWTFVVDKDGKIAMINSKVKAAEDSKAVMEAISQLD
ncbi:peroxiredoxin [Maioricimonas sp. JC845]|uniref:peroxiredoxin n=1 Tax=Maioricimonas sp. JC845 TaxID=3232138 RepID=UPI00345A6321